MNVTRKRMLTCTLETEATADRCDTDPWFKAFEMLRSTLIKITCSFFKIYIR